MQNEPTLKERIRRGDIILGLNVPMTVGRSELESLVASGPYDFVAVDSQHAPYNEDGLASFCKMATEAGVLVQFRIKHTRHTYLIGNIFDLGPVGLEVPQVETESTVDEAIANSLYPQGGVRSWGGQSRLGFEPTADRLEYAQWWNERAVLWMQIESVAAVTAARRLAKPGVACLSFGPADLSFSLEAHPHHSLKTVDDCVAHVAEQLQGSDVQVCYRNYTPDTRQKYIDMGVTVLLEAPGG